MAKNNFHRQREWVNSELARLTTGTHISNKDRTKLMRKLWAEAKRKFK